MHSGTVFTTTLTAKHSPHLLSTFLCRVLVMQFTCTQGDRTAASIHVL